MQIIAVQGEDQVLAKQMANKKQPLFSQKMAAF